VTKGSFAAQGILGVAYNIAEIPGLAVTFEGRVSAIPESTAYHGQFFAPGVATRIDFKTSDALNYAGIAALRYRLLQPAPPPPSTPPPPAPPVALSRTYLVFFD
jgi:hypothetical protein